MERTLERFHFGEKQLQFRHKYSQILLLRDLWILNFPSFQPTPLPPIKVRILLKIHLHRVRHKIALNVQAD